jgi:prepilin-type N-terminal cleavage/methylation domain-containing protein
MTRVIVMSRKNHNKSHGFSLMEVNIAIALISVGLLAIFSLFPLGLRESNLSVSDNHEAMFANHVLSCMEANAMQISNWGNWSNFDTFKGLLVNGVYPVSSGAWTTSDRNTKARIDMGDGGTAGVKFPESDKSSGKLIRYELKILNIDATPANSGQNMYLLQLRVMSGRYGEFHTYKNTYVTVVSFTGA